MDRILDLRRFRRARPAFHRSTREGPASGLSWVMRPVLGLSVANRTGCWRFGLLLVMRVRGANGSCMLALRCQIHAGLTDQGSYRWERWGNNGGGSGSGVTGHGPRVKAVGTLVRPGGRGERTFTFTFTLTFTWTVRCASRKSRRLLFVPAG